MGTGRRGVAGEGRIERWIPIAIALSLIVTSLKPPQEPSRLQPRGSPATELLHLPSASTLGVLTD